jgi:hypothetical protein
VKGMLYELVVVCVEIVQRKVATPRSHGSCRTRIDEQIDRLFPMSCSPDSNLYVWPSGMKLMFSASH